MNFIDKLKKMAFLAADIKDAGSIATVARLAATGYITNRITLEQLADVLNTLVGGDVDEQCVG